MKHTLALATTLLLAPLAMLRAAEPARITVEADKPGHAVSATLYGIFFEEINHAGEGRALRGDGAEPRFRDDDAAQGAKWAGKSLADGGRLAGAQVVRQRIVGWQFVADGGARGSIRLDDREPLNDRTRTRCG